MKVTFGTALVGAACLAFTCNAVALTESAQLDSDTIREDVPEVLVTSTQLILSLTEKLNKSLAELEDVDESVEKLGDVSDVEDEIDDIIDFETLVKEADDAHLNISNRLKKNKNDVEFKKSTSNSMSWSSDSAGDRPSFDFDWNPEEAAAITGWEFIPLEDPVKGQSSWRDHVPDQTWERKDLEELSEPIIHVHH